MARKVSLARAVRVTAPVGGTEQGKLYLIDGYFGMALQTAAEGEPVVLEIEQAVFETNQIKADDAFFFGERVYFDAGAGVLTTDDAGGANRLVGRVWRAKAEDGTIEFVLTGGA